MSQGAPPKCPLKPWQTFSTGTCWKKSDSKTDSADLRETWACHARFENGGVSRAVDSGECLAFMAKYLASYL